MGHHFLLLGMFLTQGLNPGLQDCTEQLHFLCSQCWTSLVAQTVKRLSTMWETWVRSLGWEGPLEKEMAIHSSLLVWNSPGQNTGVHSRSLLQGTFPTQGSNPRLLHCRWILYQLSHKGSSVGSKDSVKYIFVLLLSFP